MKKRVGLLVVIATIFVLVLGYTTFAVDKSGAVTGASLTIGSSDKFTATTPGSMGAQGGNVTFLNVTTTRSTVKWAGFLGRVTAALRLGFDGGEVLYSFGNADVSQIKTIFASPDTAFNFGNLVNATTAAVDSVWGNPQGHIDSATNTFTVSDQTVAQVSNVKAVGLNAYTAGNGTSGNSTLSTRLYNSSIFADTATPVSTFDFAFGTKIVPAQRDFKNQSIVDYELVVPVNTTGLGGVQTYFFFLDVE